MGVVGGIILAAGLSERMSGALPKQLLPVGDTTLVGVAVRHAEASLLDRVVLVTGYRAGEVAEAGSRGRTEVVHNPEYRSGNMSSFRAGAASLEGCDAVVVLLADMPGVTTAMIDRLIAEWHEHEPWAAVSSYRGELAHPLLLSAEAMGAATEAQGAKGVWRFLEAAPSGRVRHVAFDRHVPLDVNTVADYDLIAGEFPASG
ncbi:MAG: nucleotidyltransferase family protein [Acidimicrobiia bacterium]|nr:nucleotidyltransferase family protein [Acidimicrobiia bacterium]